MFSTSIPPQPPLHLYPIIFPQGDQLNFISCPCFFVFCLYCLCISSPLGPLTSLMSMTLSVRLLLRRMYSLTRPPASFSASTAPLWVTSLTSASFTRTIQSFTLESTGTYREGAQPEMAAQNPMGPDCFCRVMSSSDSTKISVLWVRSYLIFFLDFQTVSFS